MDAHLTIACDELPIEDLQNITRDISTTLNDETDVTAALPEEAGGAGTKGDPVTLATIALTALSSGTVVALFNVLKTYFERKPTLEMEFERQDGEKFKVRAEQLNKNQVDETIKLANNFFGGYGWPSDVTGFS